MLAGDVKSDPLPANEHSMVWGGRDPVMCNDLLHTLKNAAAVTDPLNAIPELVRQPHLINAYVTTISQYRTAIQTAAQICHLAELALGLGCGVLQLHHGA